MQFTRSNIVATTHRSRITELTLPSDVLSWPLFWIDLVLKYLGLISGLTVNDVFELQYSLHWY